MLVCNKFKIVLLKPQTYWLVYSFSALYRKFTVKFHITLIKLLAYSII